MSTASFSAFVLAASLIASAASAQADPGPLRFRIETDKTGIYRVSAAEIGRSYPLERIAPDRLRLACGDRTVCLYVQGGADGRLDPADDLMFYAEQTADGGGRTYVLTDRGRTWHYVAGELDRSLLEGPDDPAFARVRETWRAKAVFDPLNSLRKEILRGEPRPFWWTALVGPGETTEHVFGGEIPPVRGSPAKIEVALFGSSVDGAKQAVRLAINGVDVSQATWDSPFERKLEATVPGTAIKPSNLFTLENKTPQPNVVEPGDDLGRPRPNRLLVGSVAFTYEARLATPSTARRQSVLTVVGTGSNAKRRLAFDHRIQGGFLLFDPSEGRIWRGDKIDVADRAEIPLAVVTAEGAYLPKLVAPLVDPPAFGEGGDYVVVTVSRFRRGVEPLVSLRRAEGLKPVVVEARALYDRYGAGRFGPEPIRAFLREAWATWRVKPKYLLLVGDADLDVDFLSENETLPTPLVRTAYNGATASDSVYGDVEGDEMPELAVGRLPVRSPEDLVSIVRRIVKTETEPPPGSWRREAVFFAGEGRFGPAVDKLIESVAGGLVAKEIPAEYGVTMTYGNPRSPWFWPASDFNDAVVASFNRGAAFFNYVGHGYAEGFDRVEFEGKRYPIMRGDDVLRLDNGGRAGLVSIIACSTGHFDDARRDCVAERMLQRPNGPLAIFASSRVSHPFANALLGQGLVKSLFRRDARLGDLLRDAKARMVAESKGMLAMLAKPHLSSAVDVPSLVRDHLHLYHLFGDPASRIPLAVSFAGLTAPDQAAPGEAVRVSGELPAGATGPVTVRLEKSRASLLGSPAAASTDADAIRAAHRAANTTLVVETTVEAAENKFSATLTVPADLAPGDYVLTASVSGAVEGASSRVVKIGAAATSR
jgi:hypothetical protein